ARAQRLAAVEVEQRVGEEAPVGPVALAEVGGELDRVLDHSVLPRATAPSPAATLTARLSASSHGCPSSPSRCVSSIQVENVVYEPSAPVPATARPSPCSVAPASRPSR